MKRRDFLIRSATAGAVLPIVARASTPCVPPSLTAEGGASASTTCATYKKGSAPQWFLDMPESTWATPVTNTLSSVAPNPIPPGAEGQTAVCDDWTGGTADQGSGEFILPAQGGHNGYYGNEVYAVPLRDSAPAWRRVWGPSANADILTDDPSRNTEGNYSDGQPRSVHGYNRPCCSSDGRVWLAGLDAMGSPSGEWTTACWFFDNRARTGWTYLGLGVPNPPQPLNSAFKWQGGPAAYDRVGNTVWSAAEYAVSSGGYSVDVATNKMTVHNWYLGGDPFDGAWSVIAPSLRAWIVGSVTEGRLWILNLDNPDAGWTTKTTTGSPDAFSAGTGAVYHEPSQAILCWCDTYGASIRKLAVPSDPINGDYAWSTVTPAGSNTIVPAPNPSYPGRTYSKFQIIGDMGNGQAALCTVTHTVGSTYVYKLPSIV